MDDTDTQKKLEDNDEMWQILAHVCVPGRAQSGIILVILLFRKRYRLLERFFFMTDGRTDPIPLVHARGVETN